MLDRRLKSTIRVYEVGGELRVYEALADDSNELDGVAAVQKSGPRCRTLATVLARRQPGGGR
jgi:hypothetical protein